MKNNKIILVLNGRLFNKNKLIKLLKKYSTIIAADGAANKLIDLNIVPDHILGDLDSIKKDYKDKYCERLIELKDQDLNDLHKSILWLKKRKVTEVDIIGLDGKRFDHSIGNFSIILDCISFMKIKIFTKHGTFYTVDTKIKIKGCKNKFISIFDNSKNNKISTKNLKFELHNASLKKLYEGTLNYCLKNEIYIYTKNNILIFISN